jgi:putative endonuclease
VNPGRVGAETEAAARDFLVGTGAEIVAFNVRIAGAEIDIVARWSDLTAFIEVKARGSARYGRPAEAVTADKRRRIIRAARAYAAENGLSDSPMRFDVIEIMPGEINHIPGAFDADGW